MNESHDEGSHRLNERAEGDDSGALALSIPSWFSVMRSRKTE